ncbi:MAG: ABC transporter ATP-binding protein, partial [Sedimentibacter sp.]
MKKNKVKTTAINALSKNKTLSVFLVCLIIGVVLASLIPPQILKYIIDYNFTEKTSDGLIGTAVIY